jgi:hypothetical protein
MLPVRSALKLLPPQLRSGGGSCADCGYKFFGFCKITTAAPGAPPLVNQGGNRPEHFHPTWRAEGSRVSVVRLFFAAREEFRNECLAKYRKKAAAHITNYLSFNNYRTVLKFIYLSLTGGFSNVRNHIAPTSREGAYSCGD